MKQPIQKLILVFDARSGALNSLFDSARKLFQLNGCALCSITHGLTGEKADWRECREELGVPVEYLHRDEIPAELASLVEGSLPCVVAETLEGPVLLLEPDVLSRCRGSVSDFRGRLMTHGSMKGLDVDALRFAS